MSSVCARANASSESAMSTPAWIGSSWRAASSQRSCERRAALPHAAASSPSRDAERG